MLFSTLLLFSMGVFAQPVAKFSSSAVNGCAPILVQFTDESTGNPTSWKWELGDGTISYLQHPSVTYFIPGIYTIKLLVKSNQGQDSVTKTNFISVFAAPVVNFSVSQNTGCNSVAARFTDLTQNVNNGISSWQWDFGDGIFSNLQNPTHDYLRLGNYNVSLKVSNSNGCMSNLVRTAFIKVNGLKAGFTNGTAARCTPNKIIFQNTSTGVGNFNYRWQFGNGDSSTEESPAYTYPEGGNFTVKLFVSNQFGCIDSVVKNLQVTNPVRAAFSADITKSCTVPVTIRFSNETLAGNNFAWTFGDSITSAQSNPAITFNDTGWYKVKLVIVNANGCVDSLIKKDYLKIQKPYVSFDNLPDSGCTSLVKTMSISVSSKVPVVNYRWDFGDGATAGTISPTHTFITQGYHDISLITTDAAGCNDTAIVKNAIRISGRPVAKFSADTLLACGKRAIHFTDLSSPGTNQWLWDFGDNIQSTEQHPGHVYADTGFMNVKLIASIGGCADTVTAPRYLYIKPAIAKFKIEFTCANSNVFKFSNYSIGAQGYSWDFGDGHFSTEINPVHTYADTGTYQVALVAYNPTTGCDFFRSKTAKVVQLKPNFFASDTVVCKNTELRFTATVPATEASRFIWNFGDGTVENTLENNIVHRYEQPGNYAVKLVTINLVNCRDTILKNMYIKVSGPVAKFAASATMACANTPVVFFDSSIAASGNPIQNWKWTYGDGQTQTFSIGPFAHSYSNRGDYNVSLIVTDNIGCTDTFSVARPLKIYKAYSFFAAVDTIACTGAQIRFSTAFSEPGVRYRWDFGDGRTSSVQIPTHQYVSEGLYTVKLAVDIAQLGCSDSTIRTQYVSVEDPIAKFNMSDSFRTCPPLIVHFTDQSVHGVESTWDFGDGSTTNTNDPSHFYSYPGTYTVTLTVKGKGGCISQMKKQIVVKGPKGTLSYDQLHLCKPAPIHFTVHSIDAVSYIWDFNDGTTTNVPDSVISHTYTNAGYYLPKIMLVDDIGCKVPINGRDSITLVNLAAQFDYPAVSACVNSNVSFNNNTVSSEVISSWHWNFGDSTFSSAAANQLHSYNNPGIYYPSLKVITAGGCVDSFALSTPLKINSRPNPGLQSSANGCTPLTATFSGILPADEMAGAKWHWEFNNGNSSELQNPATQHFNAAGIYTVKLTATNSAGCEKILIKTIEAYALPNISITGDSVICKGTAATLVAVGANTYAWNPAASLACSNCASTQVKPDSTSTFFLTATGINGCVAKNSVTVQVVQPFKMQYNRNEKVCSGKSVTLKASGAHAVEWSPAAGLSDPHHAITEANIQSTATYTVIGTDDKGCFKDTGLVTITVNALPTVDAGQDVKIVTDSPADLVPVVSSDVVDVRWSPTGSSFRNSDNGITVKPTVNTEYTVEVRTAAGCTASDKVNVLVLSDGGELFLPNLFSPNGDGANDVFYPRSAASVRIARLKIFDKKGRSVFEKNNFYSNDISNGWNGMFMGERLPNDVYIYALEVVGSDGNLKMLKGNIALVR